MRIFRRKMIVETANLCGVVMIMTIGIFSVVKFLGLLRRVLQGHLPTEGFELILLLKLATFLDVIFTPAIYIAILLVLSRWSRENEITIFATSGIGPAGYLLPATLVALVGAVIVGFFSFVLSPYAERAYTNKLEGYQQRIKSIPFEAGEFREIRPGKNVIYFSKHDDDTHDPVRLFYIVSNSNGTEITVAKNGSYNFSPDKKVETLEILNGIRYWLPASLFDYEVTEFESFNESIPVVENELTTISVKAKRTLELIGSSNLSDTAELEWRVSKVVAVFLVVLLAFVLGSCKLSPKTSVNLVSAVFIYFIYSSFLGFIADANRSDSFGTGLFLWLPHLVIIGLIIWVVFRTHLNRPVLPAIFFSSRS